MRHLKKAAARLPFLWAQRYAFVLPGQKKARGPGRLRADGKIPSRGQFEGTGSVQVDNQGATDIQYPTRGRKGHALQRSAWCSGPAAICWIGKSGYCFKRLSSPRPFKSAQPYLLGRHTPDTGCVNVLWGKLPGMAVTKCIVLQEVESQRRRDLACSAYFHAFTSR